MWADPQTHRIVYDDLISEGKSGKDKISETSIS